MDMTVECWSKEHLYWAIGLGVPMLAIYVVGMPVFALMFLFKNRKLLNTEGVRMKYMILY